MEIKKELIEHLVALSRLNFTQEEFSQFQNEFEKTLEQVNTLQKVDTSKVSLYSNALSLNNELRKDQVTASLLQKDVLQEAPEKAQGMFRIKKIVE